MADEHTADVVRLDSEKLHALAHPLRSRILAALRLYGPATASTLATRLNSNSGKTSYHLRKLAEAGLVNEETDRGDARDRWWSSAHTGTSWRSTDFRDDPDDRAADTWLVNKNAQLHARWITDWVSSLDEWSDEWISAADQSDYMIRLTPERLGKLTAELHETIQRYQASEESDDNQDAERVTVLLHAFPSPELAV